MKPVTSFQSPAPLINNPSYIGLLLGLALLSQLANLIWAHGPAFIPSSERLHCNFEGEAVPLHDEINYVATLLSAREAIKAAGVEVDGKRGVLVGMERAQRMAPTRDDSGDPCGVIRFCRKGQEMEATQAGTGLRTWSWTSANKDLEYSTGEKNEQQNRPPSLTAALCLSLLYSGALGPAR